MTNPEAQKIQKSQKPKGPIRTEAVIPFLIVVVLMGIYFKFFFDHNLKSAFEWTGYQVVGAEVDIDKVETSFLKGTFRVQGIHVTNPERPTHNMLQIGDIRFGVLWDGLLRAKVIIEEMAVEQIEIDTKRSRPGKVMPPKPPEPPKAGQESSAAVKEAEKIGKAAAGSVKSKYKNNVLGDIAAVLGGGSGDDQLKNIEGSLQSKKRLDSFQKEFAEKQKKWDEKMKSLPQAKEIEAIGARLAKVKTSNFKNPQELVTSLQEIDAILKEADAKYKLVSSTANDLNTDLNATQAAYKEIDALVKKDIEDLQSRLRIPKVDSKSLVMGILDQYMAPYMSRIQNYRDMAEKYVPPNIMKKVPGTKENKQAKADSDSSEDGDDEPTIDMQPRPRAKGTSYEFGRKNSYPIFWIKKIAISSKAGASPTAGDIRGQVTDISSNQLLTGKPTIALFEGNFPGLEISGLSSKLSIDNRKKNSLITFDFNLASYGIEGRDVVASEEAKIAFKKASGSIKSHGELVGLSKISMSFDNSISKINYDISAKNEVLDQILKETFQGIPVVSIDAKASGQLPDFNLDVNSNIGGELERGFNKQINKKIDEAKAKFNAAIEQAIGKQKTEVESQITKTKNQIDGEVKKVSEQINKEKQKAEKHADGAKKDSERQAQKQLEQQGQKAADELKKRLGL